MSFTRLMTEASRAVISPFARRSSNHCNMTVAECGSGIRTIATRKVDVLKRYVSCNKSATSVAMNIFLRNATPNNVATSLRGIEVRPFEGGRNAKQSLGRG